MKRTVSLVFAVFMAILLAMPAWAGDYPVVGIDLMGNEYSIDKAPEKVISLAASNTEILFALGVGDKLIGVDVWSNYPAEAAALEPKVGDFNGPDIEMVVALSPDVVFSSTSLQSDAVDKLRELGIQVISSEATAFGQIAQSIELIAGVMGVNATPLLEDMQAKQGRVEAAVSGAVRPRVYYALSFGEMGDWTCGAGTFIDEIIAMAGGENVAHDSPVPWLMYSLEQLIMDDPDVIIVSGDTDLAEALKVTPGYDALRAVSEGKVFTVDPDASSRPAPRLMDVMLDIAILLHPEADFG